MSGIVYGLVGTPPGIAKAWTTINADGSQGTVYHNICVTDTGTGNRLIEFDGFDFASVAYAIVDGGMGYTEDDFDKFGYDNYAVGSVRMRLVDDGGNAKDLASSHVFFGDVFH
jgi:hypothetical protein|tara:strand:- start:210 stop:548 length:339 start_codon:yes stop_codon:yes gene_type:complete